MTATKEADAVLIHKALRTISRQRPGEAFAGRKGRCVGAHFKPESIIFRKRGNKVFVEFAPNTASGARHFSEEALTGDLAREALRLIERG